MIEFNFILNFLDLVFLQGDLLGLRGEGPLGSADPIVKGMLPSALGIIGFSIMLNLFNAGVRKKLVDSVKLKRIMKETKTWQKARMAAFKSKDQAKIDELSKKIQVHEQNEHGDDADEHASNDDHNHSTVVDFLFSNAYTVFIHCSHLSNSSQCNTW